MSEQEQDAVYKIVAFVFVDPTKAKTVYDELKASAKEQGYQVVAEAVVEVDDKGKAHLHEAGHGDRGIATGAVAGGLLGLLGGPVGLLAWAVAGGVIGGFAGKMGGNAIPTEDLEKFAARMKHNTSAILAVVEDKDVEKLINDMAPYRAEVVTLKVGDEASAEIAKAMALPGQVPAQGQAAPGEIGQAAAIPGQAPPARTTPPASPGAEPATDAPA